MRRRFYEIIPGALAWATLAAMVFFSWKTPTAAAIFIILFDTYWLLKTVYLSFYLREAFRRMKQNLRTDWRNKLEAEGTAWKEIYHLIILPAYKEPLELIEETFRSLVQAKYPKGNIMVVLAMEERAGKEAAETATKIQGKYGGMFFKFLTTMHPSDIPGELAGKGSNETWAAKEAQKKLIDPANIPYEKIMVSVFDVDTQIAPDYFNVLTWHLLHSKHPQRASFQPIPLFVNNVFETPALARVISFSATFWQMMQQARPERLTTFSSHAMPFQALVDIGFWSTDIVSEDSRIFWQCYFHYGGDWRVEPLYYPVYMDAATASSFWQTMVNVYKQQRRWGWGVENIPYVLENFRKNKNISRLHKWYWKFNIIEGFHSWATNAIIILALGWLPLLLGGAIFKYTLLSYNLPRITRDILTLSLVGVVSSATLSVLLLPPKPKWFRKRHYVLYFLQWILMPITLIVFGAFPGLEAQTRLMLGGRFRLGFWVTPKGRLSKNGKGVRETEVSL